MLRKIITLRPVYLIVATVIFMIEMAIACGWIPGEFVRSSVGDVLVIVLIYAFLRGVTRATLMVALALSLCVGVLTELLQYIHLVDMLELKEGSVLYIVIGNTFSVMDLLMYLIGGVLAFSCDAWILNKHRAREGPSKAGLADAEQP